MLNVTNLSDDELRYIHDGLIRCNCNYKGHLDLIRELCELITKMSKPATINAPVDYIDFYENHCYTFQTWQELYKSELDMGEHGLTERELRDLCNKNIFRLSNGWCVQFE